MSFEENIERRIRLTGTHGINRFDNWSISMKRSKMHSEIFLYRSCSHSLSISSQQTKQFDIQNIAYTKLKWDDVILINKEEWQRRRVKWNNDINNYYFSQMCSSASGV